MKGTPLLKRLLLLITCLTAVLAIGAPSALANNCSVTPISPTWIGGGFGFEDYSYVSCDVIANMQWYDTMWLGDVPGVYGTEPYHYSAIYPQTPTLPPPSSFPCWYGGPHWWTHYITYRVQWNGQGFGPWHQTGSAAGYPFQCG